MTDQDNHRVCGHCGGSISAARISIMPDTSSCVSCADKHAAPALARMIYSHKTAGEVIITSGAENCRRLQREYQRAR